MENVRNEVGDDVALMPDMYAALENADVTNIRRDQEWTQFRSPDWSEVERRMADRLLLDGRNLWDPEDCESRGFMYFGIGRGRRG